MGRINAGECSYMDVEWYGVDKKGHLTVFCSAGVGNLPEFVCCDIDRADFLVEYFNALEEICESRLYFESTEKAEQVATKFSNKGLYYFNANDGTMYGMETLHKYYTKLSAPCMPLYYGQLPEHIKKMLNTMNIDDFSLVETVSVNHAY